MSPADALAEVLPAERLRVVAALIRTTGDWDLAEDALADAVERALRRWPEDGVPDNPAAWLTTTARRRAVDLLRRRGVEREKLQEVAAMVQDPAPTGLLDDDRLRLVFVCCHPALALEARVALTLKVVCGLSTEQVARSFLVAEPTMGQRLLRAKKRIKATGIPFLVPAADALPERLEGVLAVVYLVFTQGWGGAQDDELAEEAIRLGRLLTALLPAHDEPRALLALMLLQHSRRDARLVEGELVRLGDQDRSRWDHAAIVEALALEPVSDVRGPYRVQADLAAVHARAPRAADTDWSRAVRLYDELLVLDPSPVVALNRVVAVGMADGPLAGLAALADVDTDALAGYPALPLVLADLLDRAGRRDEARETYLEAAALAATEQERTQIRRRAADL